MRTPIDKRPSLGAAVTVEGLGFRVLTPLDGIGGVEALPFLGFQSPARFVKLLIGVVVAVPAGVLGLDTRSCFLLILTAVSCIVSKSAFHWGTGNRCFAEIARIRARTRVLEAKADSIAALNWLLRCLLVLDSTVNHHLDS